MFGESVIYDAAVAVVDGAVETHSHGPRRAQGAAVGQQTLGLGDGHITGGGGRCTPRSQWRVIGMVLSNSIDNEVLMSKRVDRRS